MIMLSALNEAALKQFGFKSDGDSEELHRYFQEIFKLRLSIPIICIIYWLQFRSFVYLVNISNILRPDEIFSWKWFQKDY